MVYYCLLVFVYRREQFGVRRDLFQSAIKELERRVMTYKEMSS